MSFVYRPISSKADNVRPKKRKYVAIHKKFDNGEVDSKMSCVMPEYYKNIAERIKKFEVRDDDIWIVTYPKCGELIKILNVTIVIFNVL